MSTLPTDDAEGGNRIRRFELHREGDDEASLDEITDEEIAEARAEAREGMEEAQRAMAEHRQALAEGRRAVALAQADMPRFEMRCEGDEPVQHRVDEDGRQVVIMCRRAIHASANRSATMGLREAQRAIRNSEGMPDEVREQILEELEQEIDRLEEEAEAMSYGPVPLPAPNELAVAPMPVSVNFSVWPDVPRLLGPVELDQPAKVRKSQPIRRANAS